MPEDLQTILMGNTGASMGSTGGAATTTGGGTPAAASTPLLDALTERLTQQGQGIASSASSNLQNSINEAIASTQTAGSLTKQGLQSEREREIAYARDRAGATYTGALEERTGYATQVAGLRELTETTEKSIRDLDKRYQEAILASDAATAQRVADMQLKKQEFLMQQEQNFYTNLMSVATLEQNAMAQAKQSEQFWAKQDSDREQFVMSMAQSSYQFQKNLGISLQELGLKEQGLELERQRNAISLAEYNLKKSELNKEKDTSALQGMVFDKLLAERNNRGGGKLGKDEAFDLATAAMEALAKTGVRVDLDATELTTLLNGTFKAVNEQALTTPSSGYGTFTDPTAGRGSNGSFFSGLSTIMSESMKPLSERDPRFQTGSIIPNTKASWALK